ncbi:MAG: PH domain-containing protein [Micrococcales bacterium]|nr:PH domain-containing protein [Micrococcales bacterium]
MPGEWRRVSSRYIVVDLVGTVVGGLVLSAFLSLPWLLSGVLWLAAFPAGTLLVTLLVAAITPRRVRSIGYRLRQDDLVFRRGILWQRVVAVPYGRMQLVDVTRGPIERALGMSQLKLVTAAAASAVSIPGLPQADAESLRDSLVELAETRRAGL